MLILLTGMIKKDLKNKNYAGFSLVEVLISIAIFSMILLVVLSFFLSINASNSKTKADREAQENAKMALEKMTYEIRSAKSIYTPTTTSNQLSLETARYLPTGEISTFIDFFLCGSAICLKTESQDPIILTSSSVQVTSLEFTRLLNGTIPSVRIDLTVNYVNPSNSLNSSAVVNLTSTASLRNY